MLCAKTHRERDFVHPWVSIAPLVSERFGGFAPSLTPRAIHFTHTSTSRFGFGPDFVFFGVFLTFSSFLEIILEIFP